MDDINTKEGKREFINSLMDSLKQSMIDKVNKMPDDWDGHELRWFISEYAQEHAVIGLDKKSGRYRAYVNQRIIKNI